MAHSVSEIIDSDGHIFERDEEIHPYLPKEYQDPLSFKNSAFFPSIDGWRRGGLRGGHVDAAAWGTFLDEAEISRAVIYPTAALGFGFGRDRTWAIALARGYNDFVADRFMRVDQRLTAVALLPVQDPLAAADELRRTVNELGMVGGLLPAVGLRIPYGDRAFDPLYAAAEELEVPLAVHGAPRQGVGIDGIDDPDAAFVLAHPYSVMTQFTSMVFAGVWDRFPRLGAAFLETGCGWVPYLMERIDRRTEGRMGRRLASEQVRQSPIYFHAELEEREVLPTALSVVGDDRFVYATDFPHESAATATQALEGFLAREDVSQSAKQKILCDNVQAMYGMR